MWFPECFLPLTFGRHIRVLGHVFLLTRPREKRRTMVSVVHFPSFQIIFGNVTVTSRELLLTGRCYKTVYVIK